MNYKHRDRFKRMPLALKYRWRGMAKSNTRKQNRRRKFMDVSEID
jgi:hypothetical protein